MLLNAGLIAPPLVVGPPGAPPPGFVAPPPQVVRVPVDRKLLFCLMFFQHSAQPTWFSALLGTVRYASLVISSRVAFQCQS